MLNSLVNLNSNSRLISISPYQIWYFSIAYSCSLQVGLNGRFTVAAVTLGLWTILRSYFLG